MSSLDTAPDESVRKIHPDVVEMRLSRHFELDGVHDGEIDDSYHGQFTRNDRRDMDRMGKVQELRVGTTAFIFTGTLLIIMCAEEFPLLLRLELHCCNPGHVGGAIGVSQLSSSSILYGP